ncbi:MAG: inositol phosphatase [Gammaproteobacteria bacterium]|nr:inositol phosphatase [Gammaproteobacteria bacterium]MDE2349289.1 inositol phosphatase [Gammaproteobacteria bacterium]
MPPPKPRLSRAELDAMLPRIFAALREADEITLGHLHRVKIRHKADGSEVTVADKSAERLLRRHLNAAWPRDAVLGEEYGGSLGRQGRCWLIDPIDGTASYVLGLPMWGTLLSLLIDGEPVFGCIHLAALKETTYAARGLGCWLTRDGSRPRRVHVGAPRALAAAQVGLTSFKESDLLRRPGPWRLANLARTAGRIRLVGDCVQYALLCRGVLDAAVDPLMKPWDIGAIAPCVLEAGGSLGDLDGNTSRIVERTSLVAASTPALRRAISRATGRPTGRSFKPTE